MSAIKQSKTEARTKISEAIDALHTYLDELEADEDFGPIFDGSTMQQTLLDAVDRLSEGRYCFQNAHKPTHFGL